MLTRVSNEKGVASARAPLLLVVLVEEDEAEEDVAVVPVDEAPDEVAEEVTVTPMSREKKCNTNNTYR